MSRESRCPTQRPWLRRVAYHGTELSLDAAPKFSYVVRPVRYPRGDGYSTGMQTTSSDPGSPRAPATAETGQMRDDQQSDRLAFLQAGRWILAVASVATALLLGRAGQSPRLLLVVPFVLVVTATWICIRMGRYKTSYRVGVYGTWGSTLVGLLILNGVDGPTVILFPLVLMMAGWLLGTGAALALTIATPAALVFMAFAQNSNWPLPVSYPPPPYYAALVQSGVVVGAGLLGYFSARTVRAQLRVVQDSRDELERNVAELTAREHELRATQTDLATFNTNLEKVVRERTTHLQTAIRDLESFSYSVSHDLRAPLRAISGYLHELIEAGGGLHDEQREPAQAIGRHIVRMGKIIDGLLELARVNRVELRRATIDMRAMLADVLEEWTRQHPGTKLSVDELPDAVGDPTLIRQVLANLVGNAFKYSARRETPQVHVGWSESDRAWFVSDNGIGFDMSDARRLFDTFERLPDAKDFEGTGVGLAVVKSIVERHGGKVWADARPDGGATFYFTLRAAAGGADPAAPC